MLLLFALALTAGAQIPGGTAAPSAEPHHGRGIPIAQVGGIIDTMCSRPRRAGIKARLTLPLGAGGAADL